MKDLAKRKNINAKGGERERPRGQWNSRKKIVDEEFLEVSVFLFFERGRCRTEGRPELGRNHVVKRRCGISQLFKKSLSISLTLIKSIFIIINYFQLFKSIKLTAIYTTLSLHIRTYSSILKFSSTRQKKIKLFFF